MLLAQYCAHQPCLLQMYSVFQRRNHHQWQIRNLVFIRYLCPQFGLTVIMNDPIQFSDEEKSKVNSILSNSRGSFHYFKAELLPSKLFSPSVQARGYSAGGDNHSKRKAATQDVYCYFSSKHLVVARYQLLVFRKIVASFRLTPLTKMEFVADENLPTRSSKPFLQIDDGIQLPVQLWCSERNILVASFVKKMLKNIGRLKMVYWL